MEKNTTFKKVPGERWLYEYRHRDVHGQWSRKFYAIFNDKRHHKRRTIPLPEKLARARAELQRLKDLNDGLHDFDREKEERRKEREKERQDITMDAQVAHYFDDVVPSQLERVTDGKVSGRLRPRTVINHRSLWNQLESHFGTLRLSEVAAKVPTYVTKRRNEGKSDRTVFVELQFLKKLLILAWKEGNLPQPLLEIDKPQNTQSYRAVTDEEYRKILVAAKDNLNVKWHVIIQRQAGMRPNDPKVLTWPMVDLAVGVIRLPGHLLKEKRDRVTPISYELRQCFDEIKNQQRVGDKNRHVLVNAQGQPFRSIRNAWNKVLKKAKLPRGAKGVHQHGLRVAAVTDWENHGIPEPLARRWYGHARNDVHSVYEQFTDAQMVEWFTRAGFTLSPDKRSESDFLLKSFQTNENRDAKTRV